MQKALPTLLAACLLAVCQPAVPAFARGDSAPASAHHHAKPAARQASHAKPQSGLIENKYYINAAGKRIHAPAHTVSGLAPAGASAQCRDGSYSFSAHRSGTCSRHGGVQTWLGLAK